mgnify:CR=1 FL=1
MQLEHLRREAGGLSQQLVETQVGGCAPPAGHGMICTTAIATSRHFRPPHGMFDQHISGAALAVGAAP